MCRNNFYDIFNVLRKNDKELFTKYMEYKEKGKQEIIFRKGYWNDRYKKISSDKSLLVTEWILSITDPKKGKEIYIERIKDKLEEEEKNQLIKRDNEHDLLSPPPFCVSHDVPLTFHYSMGREEYIKNDNIRLEFRDISGKKEAHEFGLSFKNTVPWIREFSKFASMIGAVKSLSSSRSPVNWDRPGSSSSSSASTLSSSTSSILQKTHSIKGNPSLLIKKEKPGDIKETASALPSQAGMYARSQVPDLSLSTPSKITISDWLLAMRTPLPRSRTPSPSGRT